ncbi:radial spoke head protein 9 homolog isoform 3-T3 [Molossus nigricans]
MDSESLLLSLELASGSGQGLSPDRRASLLTSLLLVKRDYRYSRVLFWGRILGLVSDYYIAQGLSEDHLAPRKTLYRWRGHPGGRDCRVTQKGGLGGPEEWAMVRIKEETRLVSIIDQIDKAVAILPRGALFKTPFGPTHVNRTFEGLTLSEAKKLSSYFHFREPVELKNKTLLEKADLDPSLDFMDSLEHDIPKVKEQKELLGASLPGRRQPEWTGLLRGRNPKEEFPGAPALAGWLEFDRWNLVGWNFLPRVLEHPDGERQRPGGAAQPALARPHLLPRSLHQELWLHLRGHCEFGLFSVLLLPLISTSIWCPGSERPDEQETQL